VELGQANRQVDGVLLWLDRYTICVNDAGRTKVIHKAAIAQIYLAG
jgi:sRNA-binding regulator protein Hfq